MLKQTGDNVKMMELLVEVDFDSIANAIAEKMSRKEIMQFLLDVDLMVADENFTDELISNLKESLDG